MKRFLNVFIIFLILITNFRLCPLAAEPVWPSDYGLNGREMPFKPYDKSVTFENPPSFSWPFIEGAVYDLVISKDEALTEISYSANGITANYYNFPHSFEKGIYYWSVRFKTIEGASEWTAPSRFRIDDSASEFTVPGIDILKERIGKNHPRIFFNSDTVNEFKKSFDSEEGRKYISRIRNEVDLSRISEKYKEPDPSDYSSVDEMFSEVRIKIVSRLLSDMNKSALLYVLYNDASYGEYAKELLLNISSWSTSGITSYTSDDMTCRDILLNCSLCYDWIYGLLSEDERAPVLEMLKVRGEEIYFDLVSSGKDTCIHISPYNSHGVNALGYLASASVALIWDLPEAEEWFSSSVPLLCNVLPVWGNEDGSFSQGTYYYHVSDSKTTVDILRECGIIDIGKKPWYKNEYLFPLYMYPKNSYGAFGDYSYIKSTDNMKYIYGRSASLYDSPVCQWAAAEEGNSGEFYDLCEGGFALRGMLLAKNKKELSAVPPLNYEKSHLFKDTGMVAMHSDLIDENRISMYFKSGPYGSYNHSHADQNTFVIEAFGERLAIDSGYYAYGTDWENLYTRQTYAHNGITFGDGCYGQTINSIKAKGKIEEFITTDYFDIVSGDATKAYGGPTHMKRKIIYVRPGSYIIIDEMKAKNQPFQFWLNGMKDSITNLTDNSVSLVNGAAQLDCKVLYPSVTSDVSYSFTLPDKTEVKRPEKYKNSPTQERVCFKTDKVDETKMITVLNVHKTKETGEMPEITVNDSYITLQYENGVKVTVNLEMSGKVSAEELAFDGDAIISYGESYALLSGKYFERNGKTLVKSDSDLSVYCSGKEIRLSSDVDNGAEIYLSGGETLTDEKGSFIGNNPAIAMSYGASLLCIDFHKGNYLININDGNIENKTENDSFNWKLDGKNVVANGFSKEEIFYGKLNISEGYYTVESISDNISLKNAEVNDSVFLEENQPIVIYGKNVASLSLKRGRETEYTASTSEINTNITGVGTVSPSVLSVKNGEQGEFVIKPNEGYRIESVTFNGYPLFPDKEGRITTHPVRADSSLSVSFLPKEGRERVSLYGELAYPDEYSFAAFGCAEEGADEYGIAVSKTEDFKDCVLYPSKSESADGRYGIKIKGNSLYIRAYAVYEGKTEFSEKTLFAENEYTALHNLTYEGAEKESQNLFLSGGGSLKDGSLVYSNMPYTVKLNSELFGDADYLSLINPVVSTVPSGVKTSWNGELRDYFSFDVYRSGKLYVFTSGDFLPLESYGFRKYKSALETGFIRKYNPPWNVYHDKDFKCVYTISVDVEKGKKKHIELPNAAWYDSNQWGYFVVFVPFVQ